MSDSLLWSEMKSGNRKAFESIYRNYFEVLYNYGRRFSNDESTIEDSIQDLFIELWNSRKTISETPNVKAYLMLSLKRKIIRVVSKTIKSNGVELEEYHFDAVLDVERIIIDEESHQLKKEKLQSAFDQLSSRQKEIIYLKYYANLEYAVIAEYMDMNYQSARNLLHRAISKLSKHVLSIIFIFLFEYISRLMFFS